MEHPKNSHKLCKTLREAKKVSTGRNFNSRLYSEATKREHFLDKKNTKIAKRSHAHKGYGSSFKADILNSFNPELQFTDNESEIKKKLTNLLTELRGFKFVTTLAIEF